MLEMDGGDEVFESCFASSKEYDIITAFRTDSPVDFAKFACGVAMRKRKQIIYIEIGQAKTCQDFYWITF